MLRYSDVNLQPLKDHKFKVVKEFSFKDETIPNGFVSDGASVPRIFWSLFPPNRTDYLPCAILHDYLCNKKEFKKADEHFKDCLECLNVSKFARYTMYYAVRIYHIIRYRK